VSGRIGCGRLERREASGPTNCARWAAVLLVPLLALLAGPAVRGQAAGTGRGSDDAGVAADQVRFSALAELTPRNVRGLIALSSLPLQLDRSDAALAPAPEPGSSSTVALQRARAVEDERLPPAVGRVSAAVSYIVGAPRGGAPRGQLTAWDAVKRRPLWVVREYLPVGSGALLTAGGLVFYDNKYGWLKALDARTGAVLWQHRIDAGGAGQVRGPVSYRGPGGHQYVAVLSGGRGSSYTLHAFALPH
jgi:hypothetical protein